MKLNELIDHEGWQKAWLQYTRLTDAPAEVVTKDKVTGTEGANAAYARPDRLAAYAYLKTKNPAFAQRALMALTPVASAEATSVTQHGEWKARKR